MKQKRQAAILDLIEKHEISTQDELMTYLEQSGYTVTQATVSRDIRELELVKSTSKNGNIVYMVHKSTPSTEHKDKFYMIFSQSVKHVDYAGNICVLKCFEGTANAVGVAIDTMHFPTIVGSLAGDDTLFILCRDEKGAKSLVSKIQTMLSEA